MSKTSRVACQVGFDLAVLQFYWFRRWFILFYFIGKCRISFGVRLLSNSLCTECSLLSNRGEVPLCLSANYTWQQRLLVEHIHGGGFSTSANPLDRELSRKSNPHSQPVSGSLIDSQWSPGLLAAMAGWIVIESLVGAPSPVQRLFAC